jgi:predicted Fe-Mo cluster-binding NifX family protein
MRVLIPVENTLQLENSKIHQLDHSDYACIYDSSINSFEFVPMKSICKKIGNLSVELKHKNIDSIICDSLPQLAMELFSLMGIKIYQSEEETIAANIDKFLMNKLNLISLPTGNTAEQCSSSACASCSSAC